MTNMAYKYTEIQSQLDVITKDCLDYIKKLMDDHQDKIIHFEEENAYWINLDNPEQQVRSVTSFLIYDDDLYFTIDDEELGKDTIPVSLLNSFSAKKFHEITDVTLSGLMYKANEHTDAVEAVDMLHMVEWYYNEEINNKI